MRFIERKKYDVSVQSLLFLNGEDMDTGRLCARIVFVP